MRERSDVRWAVALRELHLYFGDSTAALEAARAAIDVRPDRASLWYETADLLARLGRPREAADLLAELAKDPAAVRRRRLRWGALAHLRPRAARQPRRRRERRARERREGALRTPRCPHP